MFLAIIPPLQGATCKNVGSSMEQLTFSSDVMFRPSYLSISTPCQLSPRPEPPPVCFTDASSLKERQQSWNVTGRYKVKERRTRGCRKEKEGRKGGEGGREGREGGKGEGQVSIQNEEAGGERIELKEKYEI
eukprot:117002-Hanusia_phi.AAC.3